MEIVGYITIFYISDQDYVTEPDYEPHYRRIH